ncbi:IS21-like element helper ATPase IstB [Pseudomaricurvus alcaniphilus]|uniref:IS21-like element helper ATPase IstB n=1 Tax=Pseudomaricurvus alcaniphilus TaxID=1166482 RepID=UPI001A9DDCD0|nr:IS21-like element helper ATPase IstB [Pseudomaricurvus alcaniphilus]
MTTTKPEPILRDALKQRVVTLKLYGLLVHWDTLAESDLVWLQRLLDWEEVERRRRGLERRLSAAHIGRFKPLADFDWGWPAQCDQAVVAELMTLGFIKEAANLILVGPNGVGKSMIAQNIAHHAVMQGHSALFVNAAQMLGDLAAQDGDNALRRRLKHYAHPDLLAIDEVGYLSYGNRHADLLFDIVNRRYERKSTIVTTNRPFAEWSEVFPNAACVVSIVDRLVHHSEILVIEGESYRMKEAKERAGQKRAGAKARRATPNTPKPSA